MRSNTSRSWRGWVYGILVAALLSLGFWYADHYSQRKGKSFFLAERTTKHTAVSTSFPVEVASVSVLGREKESWAVLRWNS